MLTLTVAANTQHSIVIGYTGTQQVSRTIGKDVIIGSDTGRSIVDGLGDDRMAGGGGFVFGTADGKDTVLDFDIIQASIHLVDSAAAAPAAFSDATITGGLTLSFSARNHIFLADIASGQLTDSNIILLDSLV